MQHWKNYSSPKNYSVIISLILSFTLAVLLSIVPLPYKFQWLMPNWLVLVLIYWIIFDPELIGLVFTFILGLVIDSLLGNFLGITSLCLIPVTFFADKLGIRFNNLAIPQQFSIILVLLSLNHLVKLSLQLYIKHPTNDINYWLTIITSIIFWPIVCSCLNLFRKVIKFC